MARSPINLCVICKKPIVRMRKVVVTRGRWKGEYHLEWSRAKYCGAACEQVARRRRRKLERLQRVFGDL